MYWIVKFWKLFHTQNWDSNYSRHLLISSVNKRWELMLFFKLIFWQYWVSSSFETWTKTLLLQIDWFHLIPFAPLIQLSSLFTAKNWPKKRFFCLSFGWPSIHTKTRQDNRLTITGVLLCIGNKWMNQWRYHHVLADN